MSRARARARDAREAARLAEREQTARARARQERLRSLRPGPLTLPRRPRRYGALSVRLRLGLIFGWLAVQWVLWQLVPDPRSRIGLAVITLFALPVLVVLIRTPPKGS